MIADEHFRAELARLQEKGLRRRLRLVDGPQGTRVTVAGQSVLSLCSNNYLGLADHPALVEAAARAARELGVGAGASRLVSGSMRIHHELEERLAAFKQSEASLLFASGYHANIGSIAALVGPGDAVFSDELNHASLIDGCRLSRADTHVYAHADPGALEEAVRATPARRRLIVTDSIFSMDGDAAPLRRICEIAKRYDCMLMVDEAHAAGVIGPHGGGLADELDLTGRITVQMGTLSKAFGCSGAYVAGSRALVDYLINTVRSFIYTTAPAPPVVAAAAAALTLIVNEPERRKAVRRNARRLRKGLREAGYEVAGADDGHILPVVIGSSDATMRVSEALLGRGIFAQGIRPPTVPAGTARIRATVMATHTDADIDEAVEGFARVKPLTAV